VECGNTVYPATYDGSRQWGGYPNGLIPPSAMCPLGAAGHVLRCDAAAAYRAMSAAYAAAWGSPLCITDSYRSYASQVTLYGQKPALAAVPGTSNHGWGLAVDLCGGVESFGTAQYAWMVANAGRFGFIHPTWADPGNGREEPWHWEYAGS
jgi:LAS superfamily LD-carboxypeptidase LdcB